MIKLIQLLTMADEQKPYFRRASTYGRLVFNANCSQNNCITQKSPQEQEARAVDVQAAFFTYFEDHVLFQHSKKQ